MIEVQKNQEENEEDQQKWGEVVDDIWSKHLPHFRGAEYTGDGQFLYDTADLNYYDSESEGEDVFEQSKEERVEEEARADIENGFVESEDDIEQTNASTMERGIKGNMGVGDEDVVREKVIDKEAGSKHRSITRETQESDGKSGLVLWLLFEYIVYLLRLTLHSTHY